MDFFRVGVYHVIHISVCVVFDFVDYIPDSKGAGAFMDDDLVFLCDLDLRVGGRAAEQGIILCHVVLGFRRFAIIGMRTSRLGRRKRKGRKGYRAGYYGRTERPKRPKQSHCRRGRSPARQPRISATTANSSLCQVEGRRFSGSISYFSLCFS